MGSAGFAVLTFSCDDPEYSLLDQDNAVVCGFDLTVFLPNAPAKFCKILPHCHCCPTLSVSSLLARYFVSEADSCNA